MEHEKALTSKSLTKKQVKLRKNKAKLRERAKAKYGEEWLQERNDLLRLIKDNKVAIETTQIREVKTRGRVAKLCISLKEKELELKECHDHVRELEARLQQMKVQVDIHQKLHEIQRRKIWKISQPTDAIRGTITEKKT